MSGQTLLKKILLVLVYMRVETTFLQKKESAIFVIYLQLSYRADIGVSNKGTRIKKTATQMKIVRGFFSLSLKRAGDQKKRNKRKPQTTYIN